MIILFWPDVLIGRLAGLAALRGWWRRRAGR
jgi:hypothetical protein